MTANIVRGNQDIFTGKRRGPFPYPDPGRIWPRY